jgi:hypothetical protein
VIETFILSMDSFGSHMVDLREEAKIFKDRLTRLEELLMVLREVTHRDIQEVVLAEPWQLGEDKFRKMDLILDLLTKMEKWRRKALEHVVATLQTLRALDADMEELRTRVVAPNVVGGKIPIEVHLKCIKVGVDKVKEEQMRAILRQHHSGDQCIIVCMALGKCSVICM